MAEQRTFSEKQVGLIVIVAVCCCLVVFLAVSGKSATKEAPRSSNGYGQISSSEWDAAFDRARTQVELERTRRAAEDAAWEARQARLKR